MKREGKKFITFNSFAVDVGPAIKHILNILTKKSPENSNNLKNINN